MALIHGVAKNKCFWDRLALVGMYQKLFSIAFEINVNGLWMVLGEDEVDCLGIGCLVLAHSQALTLA